MNTTFILHGGFAADKPIQEDDNFFREIVKHAPSNAKILLVLFAVRPEKVAQRHADALEQFAKNRGDKSFIFEVADERSFVKQVGGADVIYLHGGHSLQILETMKKFPDLKNVFRGKLIAGDSAGINVLSAAFNSKMGPAEGLAIIPIKIIAHFTEEKRHALDQIHPELETVLLPECVTETYSFDI